jgi:hypothetical protein
VTINLKYGIKLINKYIKGYRLKIMIKKININKNNYNKKMKKYGFVNFKETIKI